MKKNKSCKSCIHKVPFEIGPLLTEICEIHRIGSSTDYYCKDYQEKRKTKKHYLDIKNLFKSKITKRNDEVYVNAITTFFKENIPLPKGYKYKAYMLKANSKTCNLLYKKINPFLFMDIGPIENNDIPDYKICMEYFSKKEMIEKRK